MQRSFYYWKTVFALSPEEQKTLSHLSVKNLYIKFFDVDWNEQRRAVEPVAKAIFQQRPPKGIFITPVVFITQEPLKNLDTAGLDELAVNLAKLLSEISAHNGLPLSHEIQLDCDWTANTKAKYFHLINQLKLQPFFKGKIISATIRLHQLKFVSQNGVPPVDKGLLMCYNMGNLRYPQTKNSIIDEEELKKYIGNLESYKLPLDIALPIFDWWVLFEGAQYKGLVRGFGRGKANPDKGRIQFDKDTIISGVSFKAGQWLRHEESEAAIIKKSADLLAVKLKQKKLTVILYHLSQDNLAKYDQNELESFFDSFR